MNQSENIDQLAKAMAEAQAAMSGAAKSSANPFFKSHYADLASVIAVFQEHFAPRGLSFTQFPGLVIDGQLRMVTRLMHGANQWVEYESGIPLAKADPQGMGSATTYLRRYALQSALGIPSVDDDAEAAHGRDGAPAPAQADLAASYAKLGNATREHLGDIVEIKEHLRRYLEDGAPHHINAAYECYAEAHEDAKKVLGFATTKGGILEVKERALLKSDDWNAAKKRVRGEAA